MGSEIISNTTIKQNVITLKTLIRIFLIIIIISLINIIIEKIGDDKNEK